MSSGMFPASVREPDERPVAVGVAVVLRHGSEGVWLLVGHRLPHGHLPDFWEFPGGKLHEGESPGECAVREVEEETGVQVELRGPLLRRRYQYLDREVDLHLFVCSYRGGTPQPRACRAVRWVRPENLDCYRFPDANEPVLEALRRGGWLSEPGS
jgi:mutator protein MutT